jgi:hypothetical protein
MGGMGPVATDLYCRGLIDAMKVEGADLELTTAHADASMLIRNFEATQPEAKAELFCA